MILRIDKDFMAKFADNDIAELCYYVAAYGHFFDTEADIKISLVEKVGAYCGANQRKVFKDAYFRCTHLTSEHRQFLTTIDGKRYDYKTLKSILTSPGRLLCENMMYESPVYKNMIGAYKHDRDFGNMFILLEKAKNNGWLRFANGGGYGGFKGYLEDMDKGEYKNIAKLKFCTLIDRDTDTGALPANRKNLFAFLSGGKDETTLQDTDIYTLDFGSYIWHIWYKRAIENYFPDRQYMRIGCDPSVVWNSPIADRNCKKANTAGQGAFSKNKLSDLAIGMSRDDYEEGLQHFIVDGKGMSELQLFLLKLVKII